MVAREEALSSAFFWAEATWKQDKKYRMQFNKFLCINIHACSKVIYINKYKLHFIYG